MRKTALSILISAGICILLTLPAALPCACAGERLKIAVSILPQRYFVEKIGGDNLDITVMVAPGANPAVYEPKPQQMVELSRSKLYFSVGVPFEQAWLKRFSATSPEMRVIPTDKWIEKINMEGGHEHGLTPHADGVTDPHIWLSPPLVQIQARHILDALLRIDPPNQELYRKNYRAFSGELVDLDLRLASLLGNFENRNRFVVYHPSWGYFADAYGLEQIPIELEGKEPSPREMQALIRKVTRLGIKAVLVQPQFSDRSARFVAEATGSKVLTADPLSPDWAENLLKVGKLLKEALR